MWWTLLQAGKSSQRGRFRTLVPERRADAHSRSLISKMICLAIKYLQVQLAGSQLILSIGTTWLCCDEYCCGCVAGRTTSSWSIELRACKGIDTAVVRSSPVDR